MPFDVLPGHHLQIPQVNYAVNPGKQVIPTASIVGDAIEKAAKIAEMFSPEYKAKKRLDQATIRAKLEWLDRYGLNTPAGILALQKESRAREIAGYGGHWDYDAIGASHGARHEPNTPTRPLTAPPAADPNSLQGVVEPVDLSKGERLPSLANVAIPKISVRPSEDIKNSPEFKKAVEDAVAKGKPQAEAESELLQKLKPLEPDTHPNDFWGTDEYANV